MFEDITLESLKTSILSGVEGKGWSVKEGSFADVVSGPIAAEMLRIYLALPAMLSMFYVDETSGLYIDKAAGEFFGIERKAGAQAVASITFEGETGLTIPAGTVFLTAGGLEFTLGADVTLDENGKGVGEVFSDGAGVAYNIAAGELTQMYVTLAGLTSFSNGAATGGTDAESDAALFARLDQRRKRPPSSGNCYYYEQLALETDGVGLAKTVEMYDGPGTVGIIIADENGRPVDESVCTACAAHVETGRLVGTGVTVISVDSIAIEVTAEVRTDGTVTLEQVQVEFVSKLDTYLRSLAETWAQTSENYELVYNRVAFLLLDIDGVTDFTSLAVNGGTGNITLTPTQAPVLGEVIVHAATD